MIITVKVDNVGKSEMDAFNEIAVYRTKKVKGFFDLYQMPFKVFINEHFSRIFLQMLQ